MDITHHGDSFLIMQVADAHLDFLNDGPPEEHTLKLISDAIDTQKPDLVISTGDLLSSQVSEHTLRGFCEFMAEKKQRWAFVFGNHDAEYGAPAPMLEQILLNDPWCIYEHGDPSIKGYGNYVINIWDKNDMVKWTLYMMDSGAGNKTRNIGGWDYMDHTQVYWYAKTRDTINARYGPHSSLFFFHIPLPEYHEVWNTKTCLGSKNESICAPKINSGLFTAMLEDGGAKGVFVGHDHTNDFVGELYGVRLCYGRGTGFRHNGRGGYGKEGFLHGVRMIKLGMGPEKRNDFTTYLYLEDGTVETEPVVHEPEQA
ncbi:MAG TPA: metallophosphoesterase family protein [Clostridiales bacterium]|jgi:hypothetical protein|nr:metallophosphoesterase family protein [Clostridiales bacterium]